MCSSESVFCCEGVGSNAADIDAQSRSPSSKEKAMSARRHVILLLSLVAFFQGVTAQQLSIPDMYIPIAGDTLDATRREHYTLFPTIDGFQWAAFYAHAGNSLSAVVCVLDHGVRYHFVIDRFQSLSDLEDEVEEALAREMKGDQARAEMTQRQEEDAITSALAGENLWRLAILGGDVLPDCRLDSLNDESLVFTQGGLSRSIPVNSIIKMSQQKESHFWLGAGLGLLAGATIGALIGAAAYEEPEQTGSIHWDLSGLAAGAGGAIGGLTGLVVGGAIGASTGGVRTIDLERKTVTMKLQIMQMLVPR